MEEKFNKIKQHDVFFAELSVHTRKAVSTIAGKWFNKKKGFKVPEKHLKITIAVMDKCMKFEEEEQKIFEKYFIPKI